MNRKRTTLLAAGLLALLALPALGDSNAGGQGGAIAALVRRPEVLVRVLKLSSSQTDSLKGFIQTLQGTVKPLYAANEQIGQQIQTALASPAPDNCAIGKLVVTRHQNDLAIVAAFAKFDKDFSAILTPEQLAKYQRLKHQLSRASVDEEDEG
jgi:Spy/CpxP family protein refolding chaperone